MEQQNKYRVIVSARAAQMLVSHAAFLAQVSPAAAERLTVEFEKAAKSLEQMPQRCPWLRGEYIPKNAYRFILFEKRYMLMQVSEDDETYQNPVDLLFEDLGKKKPKSFAVRQYKLYKLAAGKTAKSILISCGARLAPFDIQEVRDGDFNKITREFPKEPR